MPARPRWLLALPDAIEQLERIARARDAVRAAGARHHWGSLTSPPPVGVGCG